MVLFCDQLTLDAPKRLKDGYVAVRARAAKTGVYEYAGREVDPDNKHGLRDQAVVNVLRDEKTVFDAAAVQSFIGKPVTDNHPSAPVTADNWRDVARGTIMGAIRDGDYLAFDLLLTDADAIAKVNDGKRELSNGYGATLEFGDFTAPDGTKCQARQSKITGGNHVALVDRGRAGPDCAIPSFADCGALPADLMDRLTSLGDRELKTLTIDGLRVPNVSDEAEAAIVKLQADLAAAETRATDAEGKVAAAATEAATKDAEIETLKAQVADSAITPEKLRDAAKEYAAVVDKAKALGVTVADDADVATIQRAVVDAKVGDVAKDWTADQVAVSFATLAKDANPAPAIKPIGEIKNVGDAKAMADAALDKASADLNAWRYGKEAA